MANRIHGVLRRAIARRTPLPLWFFVIFVLLVVNELSDYSAQPLP